MSKTLTKVAIIAGAVALVATGVGAVVGATAAAAAGSAGIGAVSLTSLATYASIAATVASVGAQVTAKKPAAKGSVNSVTIDTDALAPYLMGRTYYGGVLRHDVGYGATLNKVKNPYRGMVIVYSVAGPVEGLEGQYLDYQQIPFSGSAAAGYYSGFLYRDFRLGNSPDTALAPFWSGMPNWGAAYKLSGKAAILWNLKFDKKAKRFASGVPIQGAVWKGVKCYDPRKDSTYPGGAGAHRIDSPATWQWSECPGLHALKYALGSYQNGKKVFGVGLPPPGIMIEHFVQLANVCDANGWKVGGVIFEPGDRWANMKDILQAGGAEPLFIGGKLGLKINAPRVSLDVLTEADLADGDAEITAMQSWRDRRNGIIPKFRSEANKWDYVASDLVQVAAFVAEDGEEKNEERQYNLVQQGDQSAQLAGYDLYNGRERFPLKIPCKPRLRKYGPGDMLTLELPEHDLDGVDAVIVDREIDPATMVVTLTFMEETPGKHAAALALTGTAPPPPNLIDPSERDDVVSGIDEAEFIQPATNITVTPSPSSAAIAWRNPTTANFAYSRPYRGETAVFADATPLTGPIVGGLGQVQEITDTGGGAHYWWVVAYDQDGSASDPVGPAFGVIPYDAGENRLSSPDDFTTWTLDGAGSGAGAAIPIITANVAAAPDGTATADRMQFTRGAGFSRAQFGFASTAGKSYRFSVWMRATSSAGAGPALRMEGVDGGTTALTTSWKRYSLTVAASGASTSAEIILWSSISGAPATVDVRVAHAQVQEIV